MQESKKASTFLNPTMLVLVDHEYFITSFFKQDVTFSTLQNMYYGSAGVCFQNWCMYVVKTGCNIYTVCNQTHFAVLNYVSVKLLCLNMVVLKNYIALQNTGQKNAGDKNKEIPTGLRFYKNLKKPWPARST